MNREIAAVLILQPPSWYGHRKEKLRDIAEMQLELPIRDLFSDFTHVYFHHLTRPSLG